MELLKQRGKWAQLGAVAVLAAACCFSCQAGLRIPDHGVTGRDWPMFGGNSEHTGWSPDELRLPLELLWRFRAKGPIVTSPVVSDGVVCFGSLGRRFYLLSALDGELYGYLKLKSGISASAAIAERTVYFGTELGDDAVYALDLKTGDLLWKVAVRDVAAPLTASGSMLFVGSGERTFHALSTEDGGELWQFQTRGQVHSPGAVSSGRIYLGCDDGVLYALRSDDGGEVWRKELGSAVWSGPVFDDGRIYVGTFQGKICSLRGEDGALEWSYQASGGITSALALAEKMVYVPTDGGELLALDKQNGGQKWSFAVPNSIPGPPLVSGGHVYFGANDGHLYAVDAFTGELRWRYKTGRAISAAPVLWEDRLLVGSRDSYLYVFGQAAPDSGMTTQPIP